MSYLVLARKYRPQNFAELVGQEHIAQTLQNAIKSDRLPHAFLFTGPRGVGKTSTARIMAKSLNCVTGPTFTPCGVCELCGDITRGACLDVVEIDGASNRGIDDVRKIRDNVKFVPTQAAFKIYIIDEVHQITHDAFNALLKTLEEPPAHVKFIFATTEPHKIPQTILSRCQRFDFRKIRIKDMSTLLQSICDQEGIKIEHEALYSIARFADGSLRDAESLLDQLSSFATNQITLNDLNVMLGLVEHTAYFQWAQAIIDKDPQAALDVLRTIQNRGADMVRFFTELLSFFRDILMVISLNEQAARETIDFSEEVFQQLQSIAKNFSAHEVTYILHVIRNALDDIQRSPMPMIPAEIASIRLTHMPRSASVDELLKIVGSPSAPAKHNSQPKTTNSIPLRDATESQTPPADPGHNITAFIQLVKEKSITVGLNLTKAHKIYYEANVVHIAFQLKDMFHKEIIHKQESMSILEAASKQLFGQSVCIQLHDIDDNNMPQDRAKEKKSRISARDIFDDPKMKNIIHTFNAEVIKVER